MYALVPDCDACWSVEFMSPSAIRGSGSALTSMHVHTHTCTHTRYVMVNKKQMVLGMVKADANMARILV